MKYRVYLFLLSFLADFLLKLKFSSAMKVVFKLRRVSLKSSYCEKHIDQLPYKCLKKAIMVTMVAHNCPTVFFGVKKGEREMEAHAWAKVDNRFLTGRSGHEEFKVIAKFSSQ